MANQLSTCLQFNPKWRKGVSGVAIQLVSALGFFGTLRDIGDCLRNTRH
jgi:hypothetical protein